MGLLREEQKTNLGLPRAGISGGLGEVFRRHLRHACVCAQDEFACIEQDPDVRSCVAEQEELLRVIFELYADQTNSKHSPLTLASPAARVMSITGFKAVLSDAGLLTQTLSLHVLQHIFSSVKARGSQPSSNDNGCRWGRAEARCAAAEHRRACSMPPRLSGSGGAVAADLGWPWQRTRTGRQPLGDRQVQAIRFEEFSDCLLAAAAYYNPSIVQKPLERVDGFLARAVIPGLLLHWRQQAPLEDEIGRRRQAALMVALQERTYSLRSGPVVAMREVPGKHSQPSSWERQARVARQRALASLKGKPQPGARRRPCSAPARVSSGAPSKLAGRQGRE